MFPERINISPLPPTQGYPTVLLEPGSQAQLLISCPSAPSTSKGNSPASNSNSPTPLAPLTLPLGQAPPTRCLAPPPSRLLSRASNHLFAPGPALPPALA